MEYKRKNRELPNVDKRIDEEFGLNNVWLTDDVNGIIS